MKLISGPQCETDASVPASWKAIVAPRLPISAATVAGVAAAGPFFEPAPASIKSFESSSARCAWLRSATGATPQLGVTDERRQKKAVHVVPHTRRRWQTPFNRSGHHVREALKAHNDAVKDRRPDEGFDRIYGEYAGQRAPKVGITKSQPANAGQLRLDLTDRCYSKYSRDPRKFDRRSEQYLRCT